MPRGTFAKRSLIAMVVGIVAMLAVAGCGGDDSKKVNDTDRAFIQAMLQHHAMAVRLSQYQYENGKNKKIRSFARDTVNFQMAEISELDRIGKKFEVEYDDIYLSPLSPLKDEEITTLDKTTIAALKTLGLTPAQAGMEDFQADVVDDEYVAQMLPNHRGSVKMSQEVIANGQNAELEALANDIVQNQNRQITELQTIEPK